MKKTVFTLNVNGYAPGICSLTYPLIKWWANKIGADFYIIEKRFFPDFPVTYEKMQIYTLGKEMKNDWNIFIDSDALIHPETPDWTEYLKKDTVTHNGIDIASIRWRYDDIFRRDGRNIGSCNWNTIASDWCLDLWHPLDIPLDQALDNIHPTVEELNTVVTREHLIDDYAVSRNIARFGLKCTTLRELQAKIGFRENVFYWHVYTVPEDVKVKELEKIIETWKIPAKIRDFGN
jgi:hypothetical protein